MATVSIRTRVRHDGTVAIPHSTREELGLREGDEVVVTVERGEAAAEDNPLLRLIGIGEGRPDGAENHDKYLYGREYQ